MVCLSVGHNYTEVVHKPFIGFWQPRKAGLHELIKVLFGVWSELRWSRGTRYYLGSCISSGEEEILGGQPIVKCSEFPVCVNYSQPCSIGGSRVVAFRRQYMQQLV